MIKWVNICHNSAFHIPANHTVTFNSGTLDSASTSTLINVCLGGRGGGASLEIIWFLNIKTAVWFLLPSIK